MSPPIPLTRHPDTSSRRDDESERFADARERHQLRRRSDRGDLGPGPFEAPGVADDLDLAAALRAAGRGVPGPAPEASARMRAGLMAAIAGGTGTDADDLDLVAALRAAGRGVPGPAPEASARMRAGLMVAIAGGADTDEPDTVPTATPGSRVLDTSARRPGAHATTARAGSDPGRPRDDRPAGAPPRTTRRRRRADEARRARRHLTRSTLAGFCAVLLVGALTVLLSRGALPGDTLHGVKRASESVEMGLASGPEARGRTYLRVAAVRLDEIDGLVHRDAATATGFDAADAALVADNLRTFEEQTRGGSRLLLPLIGQPGGVPSGVLSDWARDQSTHLASLGPSLPSEQQARAADARRLIDQLGRQAIAAEEGNPCVGTDELGPLPASCDGDTDATPSGASPATTASPPDSTTASRATSRRTTSRAPSTDKNSTAGSSRAAPPAGSSSSSSATQRSTRAPAPLPAVPLPAVPLPAVPLPAVPLPAVPSSVNVPLPVPALPSVTVPPLVPGLPGVGLGG